MRPVAPGFPRHACAGLDLDGDQIVRTLQTRLHLIEFAGVT